MNTFSATNSPYPLDAFPVFLRDTINEVVSRGLVPPALVGTIVLAALSSAIQRRVKVRLPAGAGVSPSSLYTVIKAASGERKSWVEKMIFRPIVEHDEKVGRQYVDEVMKYHARMDIWRCKKKTILGKISAEASIEEELREELETHYLSEPKFPIKRSIIRQDLSERAIVEALHGENEAISIICDEGEIALKSVLMSKTGILNTVWSGRNLQMDRAKGIHLQATNPRVTLSLLVPPEVLKSYLEKHGTLTRGSGFWARVLICDPPSTQGSRFMCSTAEPHWDSLSSFHERLTMLLVDSLNNSEVIYEFDEDAKMSWIRSINSIEVNLSPNGFFHDMRDFASKAGEMAARIAAIFHHATGQTGRISVDTLNRAGVILNYHIFEFKRIFSEELVFSEIQSDTRTLLGYIQSEWARSGYGSIPAVPRNQLLRNGPIRPKSRFDAAMQQLQVSGQVHVSVDRKRRAWVCFPGAQTSSGPTQGPPLRS